MKKVFFGERGITATSANHLANIAKECVKQLEDKLNAINFVNQDISLLAGGNKRSIKIGTDLGALEVVPNTLYSIAEMKAFMAWVREAIKAKETLTAELHKTSIESYCERTEKTLPIYPNKALVVTNEDVKAKMSIKDMNEYFTLESIAAQIGNYIHPGRPYAIARETAIIKTNNPVTTSGSGTDVIVYEFGVSIPLDVIDKTFFELQNKHREISARLNQIKYNIEQEVQRRNLKIDNDFREAFEEYSKELGLINSDFLIWKTEQLKEIQNLKIVIPEDLQKTFDFLTNLK